MHLTDIPIYHNLASYKSIVKKVVTTLSNEPTVLSIYQIGGINDLGISDLDFLVVVKEGERLDCDVRSIMSDNEQYILTHGLYGASEKWFNKAQKYSFFHNYKCLYGKEYEITNIKEDTPDRIELKRQIALEYLVKMLISTSIEKKYNILRVRGFLLHVKALLYDLEFLNISKGECYEHILQLIEWRNNWFSNKLSIKSINDFYKSFYSVFFDFLVDLFSKMKLFLPDELGGRIKIYRNIDLVRSAKLNVNHSGIVLPSILCFLGKKYFNLQHRINRFEFSVPCSSEKNEVLEKRYNELVKMSLYNKEYMPAYMPMSSSLGIF